MRVRDFHAIGMERFQRNHHFFEVVDVLPVNDEVSGERDAMFADPHRQLQLMRVRPRSGNPIGTAFA